MRSGMIVRAAAAATVAAVLAVGAGVASARSASPWLGVATARGSIGVRVVEVIDGSPAQKAGLAAGDQIVAVGGVAVHTPSALTSALARHRVGERLRIAFERGGRRKQVAVLLAPRLSPQQLIDRNLVGKPAPDFQLPVVSGHISGQLGDLRGQVVLIEFFATWCRSCRSTHPALSRFAARGARRGLAVIAIAGQRRAVLDRFVRAHRPAFAVLRDPSGKTLRRYLATAIPMFVVIGRDGVVRYAGIGAGRNFKRALDVSERLLAGGDG